MFERDNIKTTAPLHKEQRALHHALINDSHPVASVERLERLAQPAGTGAGQENVAQVPCADPATRVETGAVAKYENSPAYQRLMHAQIGNCNDGKPNTDAVATTTPDTRAANPVDSMESVARKLTTDAEKGLKIESDMRQLGKKEQVEVAHKMELFNTLDRSADEHLPKLDFTFDHPGLPDETLRSVQIDKNPTPWFFKGLDSMVII